MFEKKGQYALETAIIVALGTVLLTVAANIGGWFQGHYGERQPAFESTRVAAASKAIGAWPVYSYKGRDVKFISRGNRQQYPCSSQEKALIDQANTAQSASSSYVRSANAKDFAASKLLYGCDAETNQYAYNCDKDDETNAQNVFDQTAVNTGYNACETEEALWGEIGYYGTVGACDTNNNGTVDGSEYYDGAKQLEKKARDQIDLWLSCYTQCDYDSDSCIGCQPACDRGGSGDSGSGDGGA